MTQLLRILNFEAQHLIHLSHEMQLFSSFTIIAFVSTHRRVAINDKTLSCVYKIPENMTALLKIRVSIKIELLAD